MLGNRRKDLLRHLLDEKTGLTVDELSQRLAITRNAVRQHLAGLEKEALVVAGTTRPTGGRPEQLYVLTDAGREFFPRQYSWLAQLVIESIREELGSEGLRRRLTALGAAVARRLRVQYPHAKTRRQRVAAVAELMEHMGYHAAPSTASGTRLEAKNCVFHDLARKNPEVCQFDIALLASFTDSRVDHEECMAKGGNVCRFRFAPRR